MSIQIKRGMKKDLPQLKDGELAFCKDTKELYVGNNGNENVSVTKEVKDRLDAVNSQLEHNEKLLSDISINVKKFGAIGDGESDDTNSIKLAINYCSNNGGGTVFLPPGNYVITSSLNLPWGVNLIGVYERSVINPKFDTGYALILNGRHHIENIKFYYEDNNVSTITTPKIFPASIYSDNLGYSVLRNIGLGNSYVGMYLKTISGGCSIENIYGYPLKTGINIEHCVDVTPINRVHFNPNFFGVPKLELRKFVFENGEAIRIGRLDFCNIDKAFAWGYKTLFTLTNSPKGGSANNIKFTNWIADACQTFCIFEHHDGGISFTNGTGTFYNPYEAEEIQNGITPTSLGNFVVSVNNGGTGIWGGSLVSFINNRIYRCEKHFLRAYNPIIFIGNEITRYANSYSEDSTGVVDCLQINTGADNSIIQGNYIDGKNKAQNRSIALVDVSNVTVTGNILAGYKSSSVYDNTKNNIVMFNNSDKNINTKGSFSLNNKAILGEFIGWNSNKLYLNIYSNSGTETINYSEGVRIGGNVQVREGDITPTSSKQNIGTGDNRWNNGIFNGVVRVGYNSTSNRPTNAESGSMWFDSTLGKPIWKNGSNWVDASGTTV